LPLFRKILPFFRNVLPSSESLLSFKVYIIFRKKVTQPAIENRVIFIYIDFDADYFVFILKVKKALISKSLHFKALFLIKLREFGNLDLPHLLLTSSSFFLACRLKVLKIIVSLMKAQMKAQIII